MSGSDLSDDEILSELGIDLDAQPEEAVLDARSERIIAGFEDIQRFYQTHQRLPQKGENRDIFERLYAVRLERLRGLPDARDLLDVHDTQGLLKLPNSATVASVELDDDDMLAELGVTLNGVRDDITNLRHVRSFAERQAAEEVAQRTPCPDFEQFQPLFTRIHAELEGELRKTIRFGTNTSIQRGDWFIVYGLTAYVAECGESFRAPNGERDARLRVIFSNGTESDLLKRSLQRALYADADGRRIGAVTMDDLPLLSTLADISLNEVNHAPDTLSEMTPALEQTESQEASSLDLPADELASIDKLSLDDIPSGTIYVLRSLSCHPAILPVRDHLHKIGVTGSKMNTRLSNAKHDATYLLADVEVVKTYPLANLNRVKLEGILHRIFAGAQADIEITDRFGKPVKPREWFLVPLSAIDQAIDAIRDESIVDMIYDVEQARLVNASV